MFTSPPGTHKYPAKENWNIFLASVLTVLTVLATSVAEIQEIHPGRRHFKLIKNHYINQKIHFLFNEVVKTPDYLSLVG